MDNVLEVMGLVDGRQQRGGSEKSGSRFAECDLNVFDFVPFEETKDVLRGLERDVAGGRVFLDAHPNGDVTGHRNVGIVLIRLIPAELDEVDGGENDVLLLEEFANLRTNVSPQNATLLEDHEPCHE